MYDMIMTSSVIWFWEVWKHKPVPIVQPNSPCSLEAVLEVAGKGSVQACLHFRPGLGERWWKSSEWHHWAWLGFGFRLLDDIIVNASCTDRFQYLLYNNPLNYWYLLKRILYFHDSSRFLWVLSSVLLTRGEEVRVELFQAQLIEHLLQMAAADDIDLS